MYRWNGDILSCLKNSLQVTYVSGLATGCSENRKSVFIWLPIPRQDAPAFLLTLRQYFVFLFRTFYFFVKHANCVMLDLLYRLSFINHDSLSLFTSVTTSKMMPPASDNFPRYRATNYKNATFLHITTILFKIHWHYRYRSETVNSNIVNSNVSLNSKFFSSSVYDLIKHQRM